MNQYAPWISVGTRVGPYVVEDRIGRGGMGEVYRARHHYLDGDYAIKVLHLAHPDVIARFLGEGRYQSKIRHPNVVRVHDVLLHAGFPALVMDLVDGGTLDAFLARRGQLKPTQIDTLARGIIRGLRTAHHMGIVHRDLKPLNILLQRFDHEIVPRIADFGLAKLLVHGSGAITRAGQVFGTPNYMAPEQLVDSSAVDQRTDMFALGCVLYELVTQRPAFPGEDMVQLREAITNGRFVPVNVLRPNCPERMVRAIEGCLEPKPERRIEDCERLEEIWAGTTVEIWGEATLTQISRTAPSPAVPATVPGSTVDVDAVGTTVALGDPERWTTELCAPGAGRPRHGGVRNTEDKPIPAMVHVFESVPPPAVPRGAAPRTHRPKVPPPVALPQVFAVCGAVLGAFALGGLGGMGLVLLCYMSLQDLRVEPVDGKQVAVQDHAPGR